MSHQGTTVTIEIREGEPLSESEFPIFSFEHKTSS